MNTRAYSSLMIIGIKSTLVYFKDFILSSVLYLLSFLFIIFIWNAVYISEHATTIGGFSLPQIDAYFIVVGIISMLMNTSNDNILEEDIQEGNIAGKLIKPINYAASVFTESTSNTLITAVPVIIIALTIAILALHITVSSTTLLVFIAELAMGYILIGIIQFIIGSFSIYTTTIDGFSSLVMTMIAFLGGGIMPLNFFPLWARGIVGALPFQLFLYVPSATLNGAISGTQIYNYLVLYVAWLAVISGLGFIWWGRVKRNLTAVGG